MIKNLLKEIGKDIISILTILLFIILHSMWH